MDKKEIKQEKKLILIDFDGVLNTFDGHYENETIPPIKEGVEEFLKELSKQFIINLYTTRNKIIVSKWILENKLEIYITDITNDKEFYNLFVSAKCINFNGNYQDILNQIKTFSPWYDNYFMYFS